jgi:hypothetical protein
VVLSLARQASAGYGRAGLELVKKLIFASILVILNPYEEVTLRD